MGKKTNIIKSLRRFKEDLKKNIAVEKIIFFGSRANGEPNDDSDIDLIVVSKNFEGKAFRYRQIGFYENWNLDYPVDFLCYTPEEFKKLKKQVTIVREAVKRGIEI